MFYFAGWSIEAKEAVKFVTNVYLERNAFTKIQYNLTLSKRE